MAKRYEQEFTVKDKGSKDVKKAVIKINRQLDNTEKTSKKVTKNIQTQWKSVIKTMGAVTTIYATLFFFKDSIKAASDLQEVTSKFKTVFGDQLGAANKYVKELAANYAMSTREARQYLAATQDLLVPMEVQRDLAAKLSGEIVKLSADLGSFNNMPTAKVMDDIQSALVGNYETMKKYGVVLNATIVDQEAINLGLAKNKKNVDAAARAQAAYSLIVKGSKAAIGDMQRTQDSYANQLKKLHANMEDFKGLVGKELVKSLADVIKEFNDWAVVGGELNPLLKAIANHLDKILYVLIVLLGLKVASWIGGITKSIWGLSASIFGLSISGNILKVGSTEYFLGSATGWRKFKLVISAVADKLGILGKAFAVLGIAIGAYKIGKALDDWMQQFEGYRRWLVNFVDHVIQIKLILKDFFLHPFGGTEESRAKLKADLAAHAKIIKDWLEDIKTHTTYGELLPGMTLPEDKYVTIHPNKELSRKYKYIPYAPKVDIKAKYSPGSIVEQRKGQIAVNEAIKKLKEAKKITAEINESISNTSEIISSSMTDSFRSIIDGTKSVSEAFREMASDILYDLGQMIIKAALFNAIQQGLKASGAGSFLSFLGLEKGGVLPGAATGRIFSGPSSGYPVMLHGNEAVLPLRRGSDGRLGVQASGGGRTINIVNNINIENGGGLTDPAEAQKLGDILSNQIEQKIKSVIMNEGRVGGILNQNINRRYSYG